MIRLVLAFSRNQFEDWAREEGLRPSDRKVVHLRDFQDTRGLGDRVSVVILPGFWDRRDADELWSYAEGARAYYQCKPDLDAPAT